MTAIARMSVSATALANGRWVGRAWIVRELGGPKEEIRVENPPSFLLERDAEDFARALVVGMHLNVHLEAWHRRLIEFPSAVDGTFRGHRWVARDSGSMREGSHWAIEVLGEDWIQLLGSYRSHPGADQIRMDAIRWLEQRDRRSPPVA